MAKQQRQRRADQRDVERRRSSAAARIIRTSSTATIVRAERQLGPERRTATARACRWTTVWTSRRSSRLCRLLVAHGCCGRRSRHRRRRWRPRRRSAVSATSRLRPLRPDRRPSCSRWASCSRTAPADTRRTGSPSANSGAAMATSRRVIGVRASPCGPLYSGPRYTRWIVHRM